MSTTLEVLTQARDRIRDEPHTYEFMDYCHCLAGHVYLAATGETYDEAYRGSGLLPGTPFEVGSPIGDAIAAILVANDRPNADQLNLGRISHVNSILVDPDEHDDRGDDRPHRLAAIKALENTITYLSKEPS